MLFVIPTDVSAAPANSDFKDDAFYSCVIDALNESNIDGKNDRGYDYVATDSELSQLDSLSCLEKNVTDVTGLEKMVNLQGLYLSDNDISKIASKAGLTPYFRLSQTQAKMIAMAPKNTDIKRIAKSV